MKSNLEYIQILRRHLPEFQREYGVTSMAVFGSMARGDNTSANDIDILVDMPPRIFVVSALRQHLESLLHLPVDLIRRHPRLSPAFLTQISRDAIQLL